VRPAGLDKGTCMLEIIANSGDRYLIKKEFEKIQTPYERNAEHMECRTKVITVILETS
jgi:hypothetical protein